MLSYLLSLHKMVKYMNIYKPHLIYMISLKYVEFM